VCHSYDAKRGTDVIITGRNFGVDLAVDRIVHGTVRLNGTDCLSTWRTPWSLHPCACLLGG
jgi:hypothetical protein